MQTIRISIRDAESGMVIARDIYNQREQLIVNQGTILNPKTIEYLKFNLINSILIFRGSGDTAEFKVTYLDSLKESADYRKFDIEYAIGLQDLSQHMSQLIENQKDVNPNQLIDGVKGILDGSHNTMRLLEMLQCMRSFDDITYAHSFNVAMICGIFGKWLKFSQDDIEVLLLSGLIHDIGKLLIPKLIINKRDKLTQEEFEIVKTHPIKGYELMKNSNLDNRVLDAILMHHERQNGTGYPYGITGDKIHEFAQIVAIADVYDAMTADRIYRKGICPFDVVDIFEKALDMYNPKFLLVFLENIADSYINYNVKLSDGRIGEIIMINRRSLSKPVVRIDDDFIDLSKEEGLRIVEVI